mmetsp:Transcript_7963/g.19588  ORF Transcript_7963/g.19588 Transcript_7963/m.19588 type:complete len:444 (+) Transcript_7963:93-1424(+)
MSRPKSIFRVKSQQISKPSDPTSSTSTSMSDSGTLPTVSRQEPKRLDEDYITNNYDPNQNDKFELMNIKIVVYGLSGLVCEEEPEKKKKFGRKETIFPRAMGLSRREMKPLGLSNATSIDKYITPTETKASGTTTAVVSCQKNGNSNNMSFETFLPSLPLATPIATSLNKVNYDAAWPSEQTILQQDDGAKDRSAFTITRCMKQAKFKRGIGGRSNYCHQTIELGINISRGTELIRLGTASIVINGEEEGEVEMNVSTTPFVFKSKKLKKKKTKYGYFSNDSSRRFYLEKNSALKVGVQVIPEDAMRFAREKEKTRQKNENALNELLEQDKFKALLEEIESDDLKHETIQKKILAIDPSINNANAVPGSGDKTNLLFPNILCGGLSTSWVPNFFKGSENESDIPKEVITDENLDELAIHSLVSSISETTDAPDILDEFVGGEF